MKDICSHCNRPVQSIPPHRIYLGDGYLCSQAVDGGQIYYNHSGYGCDTGCCGHTWYIEDKNGDVKYSQFMFEHNIEDIRETINWWANHYNLTIDTGRCEFIDD